MTTTLTRSDRDLVVVGLRSGHYTQCRGSLRRRGSGFCAVGVAADMFGYDFDDICLIARVAGRGFPVYDMVIHNDDDGWTFDEIADWLQTLPVIDDAPVERRVEVSV